MKGQIVIYSIIGCPHCMAAKSTLQELGLPYTDISLDSYPQCRLYVREKTGRSTIPQIFFNEKHIGGNDDLQKLILDKTEFQNIVDEVKKNPPPKDAPKIPDPKTAASNTLALAKFLRPGDKKYYSEQDCSVLHAADPGDFVCEPDEYAQLVNDLKNSGLIHDNRSGIITVHKNSFSGRKFVDWIVKTKGLDRATAVQMGQQLIDRHFGSNVHKEEIFQDNDIYYRLMEDDDVTALNAGTVSECKTTSASDLSEMLRKLILSVYSKHLSHDGKVVDYKGIEKSADFNKYVQLTKELQRLNMKELSREETLAFFINVYNALVIHANIVNGHPVNLWQRWKFFNTVRYIIGGSVYSLQDIENGVLRANRKGIGMLMKPFGHKDPRFKVALKRHEPMIHFALVCGAKSCPPIKTYSAKAIDEELKLAAESFLEGEDGVQIKMNKSRILLSKIFSWYKIDFGKNERELVEWICFHTRISEKKTQLQEIINKNNFKVEYMAYDWGLNS